MSEHDQLAEAFARMGANPAQAAVMATQILKRADQLASQRGISRAAALEGLLQLVVQGRAGAVPPGFEPSGGKADSEA